MKEMDSRSNADFQAARLKATLRKLVTLISGQERDLLSFTEVQHHLRLGGPIYRGVQPVPLRQIVGSVDRYREFDRLFLPTQSHTAERWKSISSAWYKEISLPPVLLYQVGEVYFVIDGNHRVSVAREKGQEFIDAEVREVSAKVPITPEITADDLVRLGAKVEFIERTQIDRVLPDVEIETTLLGGYDRLIEHIAVHRHFMGVEQMREISVEEAVSHWYTWIYKPVADVIELTQVLDEFKGRSTADLYLWVMDHHHYLQAQTDNGILDPAEAASDFIEKIGDEGPQN